MSKHCPTSDNTMTQDPTTLKSYSIMMLGDVVMHCMGKGEPAKLLQSHILFTKSPCLKLSMPPSVLKVF